MKTKFAILAVAVPALAIGAAAAEGGPGSHCIEMASAVPSTGFGATDAGGYSLSTGEHAIASAALLAHLEQADGVAHPTFGAAPRDILILKTESGRYVVRIMEPRPVQSGGVMRSQEQAARN